MSDENQKVSESENIVAERIGKGCGIGCFSLIIIFIIMAIVGSFLPESPEQRAEKANISCHNFVRNQLKSPASAKFPLGEFSYQQIGENTFVIKSYVDAQNSFGAMLRQKYTCKVELDKDDNAILKGFAFD